jgi:uncharacterized Zn finger protein (UPF0148 family)
MPKENRKCPCGTPLLPGKGPRKWCPECQEKRTAERTRERKNRKLLKVSGLAEPNPLYAYLNKKHQRST